MKNEILLKEMISATPWVEIRVSIDLMERAFRMVIKNDTGLDAPVYLAFGSDEDRNASVAFPYEYIEILSEEEYSKLVDCGFHPEEEFNTLSKLLQKLFGDENELFYWIESIEGDEEFVAVGMPVACAKKLLNLNDECISDDKLDEERRGIVEEWYTSADLNGWNVEDADGWEHGSRSRWYSRTIYVEDIDAIRRGEMDASSLKKTLVVCFESGCAVIDYATIDGEVVDGSHEYGKLEAKGGN